MDNSDKIIEFLDRNQQQMVALLGNLVKIDSGTYTKEGLNQMAELIGRRLKDLGFQVQRLPQADLGDHLLARKEGPSAKKLFCIGHMDTVFPENEAQRRPFRIEGEKAFGPGVIDMKGGLVVLLFALQALREQQPDLYKKIQMTLLFNSDEEIISPSSTPIVVQEAKGADTVCIFEPIRHRGQVLTKRKGVGRYSLNVYGKAAHAGENPESGISAIQALAKKILDLHALNDYKRGLTVNVGIIKGGSRFNVIADQASAEIDVRILAHSQEEIIQKEFQRICQSQADGVRLELTGGVLFPPMLKTGRSLELLRLVQEAGKDLNLAIEETMTGAGSDGNHASYYAPTIDGLGPQGTGAHSPDEVLFVPTLVERAKLFALFVKKWEDSFAPKGDYPQGLTPL
jgi:glutamate carboxypeptidase